MVDVKIEYMDVLSDEISEKIHQGHVVDDTSHGIICNYKQFAFIVKTKHLAFVGALIAYTAYSEIYVEDIWIDPNYRKSGIGRKLLVHLENRFKDKGYNNINLVTSKFQAPDFYKKCGFKIEFIRENQHNPKLTKYFFIKYFDNASQKQGIL